MTDNINGHILNTPLLTREDVLRWKDELAEAQGKVRELTRKLEAAAVFMPEAAAPEPSSQRGGASLYDAIEAVVGKAPRPMSPKAIRNAITHSPYAGLLTSENYLYTAIKRVADKGKIVKQGDGYVLALFA